MIFLVREVPENCSVDRFWRSAFSINKLVEVDESCMKHIRKNILWKMARSRSHSCKMIGSCFTKTCMFIVSGDIRIY